MAEINNVIAEASQDLQTIEDFVNLPADSKVYPRLLPSVNVGTLAGARQAIFEAGGLPAAPFATKTLMVASALVDGDYAQVTDDTVNNGLYVKTAGLWVKSDYDPLGSAINYVDLNSVTSKNDQSDLHVFTDAIGNIVATIDDKAVFNAQDFATPSGNLASITKSINTNEAAPLITQTDSQGNIIYELDSYGMPTATYSFFGVSEMESGALSQKDMNKTGLTLDRMSTANDTPIDFDVLVSAQGNDDTLTQRMPSGIKISENKMFVAFTQFSTFDSDSSDGRLVGKFITYDLEAQTASVGETRVIVGNKLGSLYRHPHFIRLKDRVLLIFNGGQNEVLVYESFDECLTFTPKTINSDAFAFPHTWVLGLDSATLIEGGLYAGRIVLALYTGANDVGTAYSDDGGSTWVRGTDYKSIDLFPAYPTLTEIAVTTNANNELVFCFRNESTLPEARYMIFAKSKDGGKTMQFFEQDTKTGMSQTQAALKRSEGVPKILSLAGRDKALRKGGTLRISYDSCKSFALEHILYDGTESFGYSSILPLDAKTWALVYEDGVLNKNHSVKIKIINLKKVLI